MARTRKPDEAMNAVIRFLRTLIRTIKLVKRIVRLWRRKK